MSQWVHEVDLSFSLFIRLKELLHPEPFWLCSNICAPEKLTPSLDLKLPSWENLKLAEGGERQITAGQEKKGIF